MAMADIVLGFVIRRIALTVVVLVLSLTCAERKNSEAQKRYQKNKL